MLKYEILQYAKLKHEILHPHLCVLDLTQMLSEITSVFILMIARNLAMHFDMMIENPI